MSAKDQMRAMLDQLMGSSRNGESNTVQYSDPKVCRAFLLSCCPFTVLAETRLELGECSKLHQLSLRPDFEAAQTKEDHFYDVEACTQLSAFIGEWDRKIEGFKRKLCSNQEALSEEVTGKVTKVQELAEKIEMKLEEAEKMGTEGMVEESMQIMEEVETLQAEKSLAEQDYNTSLPELNLQQQKLRVCEVCSAYLGIHEIDRSLADHFGGKLHLGFKELRDKLAEMQKTVNERKELQRETEKKKFEQIREDTNNKLLRLSQKERSRSKTDRSRGRTGRDKTRSRSGGSRRKRKSRSRSRSRNKRDRNRHRQRSRSNSRHRRRSKDRSRSRNRKGRRSKSRGRYRSRSKSVNRKKRSSKSKSREKKVKTSERVERGKRSSKSSDRGGRGEKSRSRSSQRVRNDLCDKHEDKHVDKSVKVEADAVKNEMTG
eukprot:TRINITY_DN13476_c0_g1_i1.p1 TRINITY_DN13476_c0_g1~~TRINITY_DN13476_c0_g1_i1.p1  ORF type:complete len:430 (-),score=145.48 TRINITY_DN13476_c0_g1_i1:146-1435(-)